MEEKYALITGGTKGIGKAVAATLVNAGYHVLLTYASDDTAANTIRKQLGEEKADVLKADVTSADAIQTIYSFLTNKQKCLDTVILNAGLTCRDSFENLSLADWERVFFANIHFPVFLLQKLVNGKKINQNGSVVFTGSLMGIHPHSVSLAYGVTKSGVHALVKNLVKFMEPYGIRVNGVAPGFVDTELLKGGKYPMLMRTDKVAARIVRAIERQERTVVIDGRYRLLVFFWRLIPRCIWERLPIHN